MTLSCTKPQLGIQPLLKTRSSSILTGRRLSLSHTAVQVKFKEAVTANDLRDALRHAKTYNCVNGINPLAPGRKYGSPRGASRFVFIAMVDDPPSRAVEKLLNSGEFRFSFFYFITGCNGQRPVLDEVEGMFSLLSELDAWADGVFEDDRKQPHGSGTAPAGAGPAGV